MDKEKTKDLIKIMQAFLEGEVIEQRAIVSDNYQSSWFTHSGDDWNTNKFEYRIKPKPQYRPFKDIDECWAEMKNHQPFGWVKIDGDYVNIIKLDHVNPSFYANMVWFQVCRDEILKDNVFFADGTPFGIKITDNCPMLKKTPKKAPK
mgnify:CR=1 FL=1|jgi:hypothetical protein